MPSDKVLHFVAGALISIFASYLFGAMTGLVLALAVGAGKELHDYLRPETNTPDVLDFIATVLGAAMLGWLRFLCDNKG